MRVQPLADAVILAIDDHEANLDLVQGILSDEGARVICATSGEEGLRRAREERPDVILLDLMMPGLSGFQVCRILASDPQLQNVPVIFVTASIGRAQEVEAFSVGAVDYITKPISPETMIARVTTQVRLIRARDAAQNSAQVAGAVAAAVAASHEVNNPLQGLIGSAEVLKRRPELPADARGDVERILAEAWRIRDVIQKMNQMVEPQFTNYAPGIPMVNLIGEKADKG